MTSFLPGTFISFTPTHTAGNSKDVVRIGIMADVHKDLMPDADAGLKSLLTKRVKGK
ncbi:MAG: hypothetical protein WDO19_22355 [Bacteroidota bacterium]